MADYQEVRPRIIDPSMFAPDPKTEKQEQCDAKPGAPPATGGAMATAKGLFTSVYENKIIVLIIVISVIVILIVAYIIYRKDDSDEKPKNSTKNGGAPPAQSAPVETQPVTAPVEAQPVPVAAPKNNSQDLVALYERARNAVNAKPAEEPTNKDPNSKADDEIMHLMEDSGEEVNNSDIKPNTPSEKEPPADAPVETPTTDEPVVTVNDTKSEVPAAPVVTSTPAVTITPRHGYCTQIVAAGRYCKNKALSNNKCKTHGG